MSNCCAWKSQRSTRQAWRLAAAVLFSGVAAGCEPKTPIPAPDLSGGNPATVKRFDEVREAVRRRVKSADAWGNLGMFFDAHEFFDEALACYERADKLASTDYRWCYLAGVIVARNQPGEALHYFERAKTLEPRNALIHYRLASACAVTGQDDRAEQHYRAAIKLDADMRPALLGLAELKLRAGKLQDSKRLLQQCANLNFYDRDVHALLARVAQRLGETEQAQIEAQLAEAHPQSAAVRDPLRSTVADQALDANAMRDRGLMYHGLRQYAKAQDSFERAARLDPGSASDHLHLGRALAEQGRLPDALAQLEVALKVNDGDPEIHSTYAVLLARAGRTEEALSHVRTALQLDPASDQARFYEGTILSSQGRTREALRAYGQALKLNPANAAAHEYSANVLARQGRLSEAIAHWEKVLIYDPNKRQVVLPLADACGREGRFSRAKEILVQANQQSPRNARILAALIRLLTECPDARLRDGSTAIRLSQTLIQLQGFADVPSLILFAAGLAEAGDFDRAVATLQRAHQGARAAEDPDTLSVIQERLQLYRESKTIPARLVADRPEPDHKPLQEISFDEE